MKIFNFDGILKESGSRVITKINASANQVDSNTPASVEEETDDEGALNLTFNIPRGASGANMFYKGTAIAHYSNFTDVPKQDISDYDTYILDTSYDATSSNNAYSAPSIATYISAPDYNWNVTKATIGDIYRVGYNLWQAQSNSWINMGSFKGDPGEDGEDGFSPIATVTKDGKIATITITDKNGETTSQISDGQDGFSPTITSSKSGKTTTLAIVDRTGTKSATILDGTDGYSPTATVTKSGIITTISITDKNGTTTAEIKDGSDGSGSSGGGNVIITLSDYDNLENRDLTITYFITD